MRLADILLFPLACVYGGITAFRNKMFDAGLKKSVTFEIPTIVIGNLAVGGTGKTPMVEFLIRKLKHKYELAILSRGYGRKSSGFVLAAEKPHPKEIGDEPFQVFEKFNREVTVAVGEERILAIPMILANYPKTEAILLDDAYQHRYLKGDLNILLTTFDKPFFKDWLLPLGRLREARKNANRAAVVVVTKCPTGITYQEKHQFRIEIAAYTRPGTLVLFAGLRYREAYPLNGTEKTLPKHIVLVTGIVNNRPMVEELSGEHDILKVLSFPDHHRYTEMEVLEISHLLKKFSKDNPAILTTEKDAVKLKDEKLLAVLDKVPVFVLPIEVQMEQKEEDLLFKQVEDTINRKALNGEV